MNTENVSKYFNSPAGPRGGTIRGGHAAKPQHAPPPELIAETRVENEMSARRAALESSRIENPIVSMNREAQQREEFDASCEQWFGTDWIEREPADKAEPLFYRLESFHWGIRASVVGPAGSERNNFILKLAATPWLPIQGLNPGQRKAAHNKKSSLWDAPASTVNQAPREEFPVAIFAVSQFLRMCRPVAGFDVSELEMMSAPDVGHEHDAPPPPPKQVTLQDVLNGLASVLQQKTAQP